MQTKRYQKLGLIDLHEYFHYEDGKLFWKKPTSRRVNVGREAGTLRDNGYKVAHLDKSCFPVHHIVWVMMKGELIDIGYELDHINGDRSDNRIENLRKLTRSDNLMNKKGYGKTSPYRGVYIHTSGKYYVRFRRDYLGMYESPEEAALVWNKAALAFSPYAKLNEVPSE